MPAEPSFRFNELGLAVTYASAAQDLHDFLVLAGTGSAALVGLLFVGLSLHLRQVIDVPEIRALARVTLSNFGVVLFASMFLVLTESRVAAAFQLIGTGATSIVVAGPAIITAVRAPGMTSWGSRSNRVRFLLRFAFSAAGYLTVIAAGGLLLESQIQTFVVVIEVVIVVLMLVALRNTWDLLVTVGDVATEDDSARP